MSEFSKVKNYLKQHIRFTDKRFLEFKILAGQFVVNEFTPSERPREFAELLNYLVAHPIQGTNEYIAARAEALSAGQAAPHDLAIAIYILCIKWPDFHHYTNGLHDKLFGKTADKIVVTFMDKMQWEPEVLWEYSKTDNTPTVEDAADRHRSSPVPTTRLVYLTIKNYSQSSASLFWVDYLGEEILYNKIPPQTKFNQATYNAHKWIVRDTRSGKKLDEIYMAKDFEEIIIK